MTADLEFGPTGDHGTPPRSPQPVRGPAMRAYCVTLARFTASVQSTEQLLRNDEAGVREDTEQREVTAASRLRGIDRAGLAAEDGLDQCAAVRSAHGLPARGPSLWDDGGSGGSLVADGGSGGPVAGDVEQGLRGQGRGGAMAGDRASRFGAGGLDGRGGHGIEYGLGTGDAVIDGRSHGLGANGNGDPVVGGREQRLGAAGPGADGRAQRRETGGSGSGGGSQAADGVPQGFSATSDGDPAGHGLDRLRRSGGADLGVALTSLGRRRDALRLAEEEFAGWLTAYDEQTRRVSIGAAVGAGLGGAAVMAVAGSNTSAATSLALLIACTLAVVAVGLGVAAARRSPRVCRGVGLARRPHPLGLARFGAQVGGLALLALTAVNVAAGAL